MLFNQTNIGTAFKMRLRELILRSKSLDMLKEPFGLEIDM